MIELYSPVSSYQNIYRQIHHENTSNLFKKMVEISGIDIEANRNTHKQITKNNNKIACNNKSIKKQEYILILLTVSLIIILIIGIIKLASSNDIVKSIGIIFLAIILIGLSIFFIKKTTDKLTSLDKIKKTLLEISKKLHVEAEEQMRPLNELLLKNYNTELFTKTIPIVKFDDTFNSDRLNHITDVFGFNASIHEQNMEQSTLFVQSGEIKGNPFFIREKLQHTKKTKKYKGSLRITWTTVENGSNGNKRTLNHSETLHAHIKKPLPSYSTSSYLVYANKVSDRLSFSRTPSYIHEVKEWEIEKIVKNKSEKLKELAEKSTEEGRVFTALANDEFDALFYATDRDNEAQFRLMFTPLAQQETINIIKDKEVGFGDDFSFHKRKMINYIYPKHLKSLKLNLPTNYFIGNNYDKVEKKFYDYHSKYFKHIFFSFAPLFAIPLYTQNITKKQTTKNSHSNLFSFYQHEMIANNIDEITPPDSVTQNIIKTTLIDSQNNTDKLNVHAWGYKTIERTEYIPTYGSDNRWHDVPVHWTEYIMVHKNSTLEVKIAHKEEENNPKTNNDSWLRIHNILTSLIK